MWRYGGYGKDCVDDNKSINIVKFKKWGYLDNKYNTGTITWSRNWEVYSRMGVSILADNSCITFDFTGTDSQTQEKKNYNHPITLVHTPCTYGGYRYWFVCPTCNQKKGILYLKNFRFACRNCLNLCYEWQKESKNYRLFYKLFPREVKAEEIYKTIKYPYRNGKPTRKYKSYLRLTLAHIPAEEIEMSSIKYQHPMKRK